MINNVSGHYDSIKKDLAQITFLCDRNFGIGSDGIIFLNFIKDADFEMEFFNPDGTKSFCGNGARCAVSFAKRSGLIKNFSRFLAIDGFHDSHYLGDSIKIKINNVDTIIEELPNTYIIDTGSPHYVHYLEESFDSIDFLHYCKSIRFSNRFIDKGINVNLVKEINKNKLNIRTYERGVENETLACGTGVTAVALSYAFKNKLLNNQQINILTLGGELMVEFVQKKDGVFSDIWLIGEAKLVYEGSIHI